MTAKVHIFCQTVKAIKYQTKIYFPLLYCISARYYSYTATYGLLYMLFTVYDGVYYVMAWFSQVRQVLRKIFLEKDKDTKSGNIYCFHGRSRNFAAMHNVMELLFCRM